MAFIGGRDIWLEFSYQSDDDRFGSTVIRINRLIVIVSGLEACLIFLFIESFERRILIIDDSDDQLAIFGDMTPAADNVIAMADIHLDHTIAVHFESEYVIARAECRSQRQRFDVLDSLYGHTRCDSTG